MPRMRMVSTRAGVSSIKQATPMRGSMTELDAMM